MICFVYKRSKFRKETSYVHISIGLTVLLLKI